MGLFKKYKGSQAPAIRLQDSEEEERVFKKLGRTEVPRSSRSPWKLIVRPKLRRGDDDLVDESQDLEELIVHKENRIDNPMKKDKKATPLKKMAPKKKIVKHRTFERLSTADSSTCQEYEPPRDFIGRTYSHDKSHGSSRTFDIQSDEASFPSAAAASVPTSSGFSVKSDQSSTEFRQFVFDKNFQKIEKVAVEMSDPGTSDFSDFVAAAASLSRLMSPVMEVDSRPALSSSKKDRARAFPIPRIKKTKATEFVPLPDSNDDGSASLNLFPSLTAESLSRANKSNPPQTVYSKDDASTMSNASGAHVTVISSPRDEFPVCDPFTVGIKDATKDLDPFHFETQSEIDLAWFSAKDPFKVQIDKIACGDISGAKSSEQKHVQASKENTPVKQTSSTDDSLIQSIKKANEKRDSDGFSFHKPDPSPRGVLKRTSQKSMMQSQHHNNDRLLAALGNSNHHSNLHGDHNSNHHGDHNSNNHNSHDNSMNPHGFAGPQRKGPPKGVPSNAILGSMLFRQTFSVEGSTSHHSRKKHKSTEHQSGWNESHPEVVAPPTHITTDAKAESTVSSVTEEASSFYEKNFQGGWAKQAYNVLEQYHRNRGNGATKRRRDPKESAAAAAAAAVSLERVDEENMFM